MMDSRTELYVEKIRKMISVPTVSDFNNDDKSNFYLFHDLLRELFPGVFGVCEFENFDGSFLLRWKGETQNNPLLIMNHHDVVEAKGDWKFPPFEGVVKDGKMWGRGLLDNKGGLFCMLQAADELIESGFVPKQDIYFESSCTEETNGSGCKEIADELFKRGIHFKMSIDEGGMILYDPIGGADGTFAMIGVGEKGCTDLKFIAKGTGGHASTPPKNTPLVRLGKFMAAVEKSNIFEVQMPDVVAEMFKRIAPTMKPPLDKILGNADKFKTVLAKILPSLSASAGAMLKTTLAFTMANGSEGMNVLPQEAWVIGNMRFSHHQGRDNSINAVKKLAAKYDIDVEVIEPGFSSEISDFNSDAFKLIEKAVTENMPGIKTAPYIMTGCSDSRFLGKICDNCMRFTPFLITNEQLATIHGLNENVDISCFVPAVDFYKYIMKA